MQTRLEEIDKQYNEERDKQSKLVKYQENINADIEATKTEAKHANEELDKKKQKLSEYKQKKQNMYKETVSLT